LRAAKAMWDNSWAYGAASWTQLTVPGGGAYHPLWEPVLLGELFIHLALIVLGSCVAWLFFRKRSSVPRLWIGLYAGVIAATLTLAVFSYYIPAAREDMQVQLKDQIRALFTTVLWIAYFLRSQRVCATFVQRRHAGSGQPSEAAA
jgi:hypothetical protein